MYNHFEFKDGGNPYITTNNAELFRMVKKYDLSMTGAHTFTAHTAEYWTAHTGRKVTAREKAKAALSAFAWEWQQAFGDVSMSWGDLVEWQDFFTEYGRKYGLLREFRENGIC